MTTIAIVGAGPGVGAAAARRFGREGYAVALIARDRERVERLAATIAAEGITARGYAADVLDAPALTAALRAAEADLGPVDVLQYSPIPSRDYLRPVLETTADQLREAVQFSVLGAHTAVTAVLDGMRERRSGTVVVINGGTAVRPRSGYAGTSVAFAGESALVEVLAEALRPDGVAVVQLVVPGAIDADDPAKSPEAVADRVWQHHLDPPAAFRDFLVPLDAD